MPRQTESQASLETVRHSPIIRWARWGQWFGLAMLVLAVALALFTELTDTPRGVTLIAFCGMLGLLSLIPARFILTLYLMRSERHTDTGD